MKKPKGFKYKGKNRNNKVLKLKKSLSMVLDPFHIVAPAAQRSNDPLTRCGFHQE